MKMRSLTSGQALVQSHSWPSHLIWSAEQSRGVCWGYKLHNQHHHHHCCCCCHWPHQRERMNWSLIQKFILLLLCALSFPAPSYWLISLSLSLTFKYYHHPSQWGSPSNSGIWQLWQHSTTFLVFSRGRKDSFKRIFLQQQDLFSCT